MDAQLARGGKTKLPPRCEYKDCQTKPVARFKKEGSKLNGLAMCSMHRVRGLRDMDMDAPNGHKKQPRGRCRCQGCDGIVYHLGLGVCKTHYWRYKCGRLDWSYPLSNRRVRWKGRVRLTKEQNFPWAPHVDEDLVKKLRSLAEQRHMLFDDLINEAIRLYFVARQDSAQVSRDMGRSRDEAWSRRSNPMEEA